MVGSEKGQAKLSDSCSSSQPTAAVIWMLLQNAIEVILDN
jgi:hypothetical protein